MIRLNKLKAISKTHLPLQINAIIMLRVEDQSFSYLDKIPDIIYQRLITHQYRASVNYSEHKSLQLRSLGVLHIRQKLLNAESVKKTALLKWLDIDLADYFYKQLSDETLLANTFENESYTDNVLLHVLDWLDNISSDICRDDIESVSPENAEREQSNCISGIWKDESLYQQHHAMSDINKRFALERKLGWDLSKGIKYKSDVNKLIDAHRVIKNSKKIQSIISLIGRSSKGYLDQFDECGFNQLESKSNHAHEILPDDSAVDSVTGVYLGDDISRMLSSELVLLGNVKFKMLWHAKRAERQLLNYHYKGLLSEHVPDMQAHTINHEVSGVQTIKQEGPMILCVDTSASMKGKPEILAKAIALEAMRIAYVEERKCYLFCFAGPDEIIRLDLTLVDSWKSIIEFLRLSFNGGTDINNVLMHALNKYKSHHWGRADILLISDGLFKAEDELIDKVKYSKAALRVFGVQLGHWSSTAFNDICHQVFDLSDA